jgi:uncharacterized membrane protein YfcA
LELIADPWFWAAAVPAVILAGISKGGIGGAGSVSTPLMALAVSPAQAATIMLVVLCILDIAGVRAYLGRWDRRILKIIIPAGVAGCVIGALTFRMTNDHWLRILLGLIVLAFLLYSVLPRKGPAQAPSDRAGWFWGTLSGFCSFVTHAGSPPLMVYLLPQRLEKNAFIATCLLYFAVINYAKILPYWWLGLFDLRNISTALALTPLGIAGIYGGIWLQKRIDARWFYRVLYGMLSVTGVKLLYDGISGL